MNRRPSLSNNESSFKKFKHSLKQTRFHPEAYLRNFEPESIVGTKSNTTRQSNRRINTLHNRNRNPGLNIDPFNKNVYYYDQIRNHSNNKRAKNAANFVRRVGTDPQLEKDAAKNAMIAHTEAQNAYVDPKVRRLRFNGPSFSRYFYKNNPTDTIKSAKNYAVVLPNRNRNPGAGIRLPTGKQLWGNVRSQTMNRTKKRAAFNAEELGKKPNYGSAAQTAAQKKAKNFSNELAISTIPESSGGKRHVRN